jgi:hypothetical protein
MRIIRQKDKYKVESHEKGTFYIVDLKANICSCPHFLYRLKRQGADCKHLQAVKARLTKGTATDFDAIISYVKDSVFVDSMELIEKFGEEAVNTLIEHGELIEEHGKIRLM